MDPDSQPLCSLCAKIPALEAEIESLQKRVEALSTKPVAPFAFGAKEGVWCDCPHLDPENGRNLVVCIDGTANQFGAKVRELCLDRYSE